MSRRRKKKGNKSSTKPKSSAQGGKKPTATNAGSAPLSDASAHSTGDGTGPMICEHYHDRKGMFDCKGHRTGLLTSTEIKKYSIIKDEDRDDANCLKDTSYDLRLGEGHMVYNSAEKKWEAKWVGSTQPPDDCNPPYAREGSDLVIPEFGMALVQLRETIDLLSCIEHPEHPVMICGHFDLKLARVRDGLISQQATQVEPGYRGRLFCYLFNQTGGEVILPYTDTTHSRIATVEFQYISCISQCYPKIRQEFLASLPEIHGKYSTRYCNTHGIDDVHYFDEAPGELGKLPRHGGLSSIAQRLDDAKKDAQEGCAQAIKDAAKTRTWLYTLTAICITLLCAIIGLAVSIVRDSDREQVIATWNRIRETRAEIASANTDANTAADMLRTLRDEAQKTYDMARTALGELDKQRQEVLPQQLPDTAETSVTSNEEVEEGDNP